MGDPSCRGFALLAIAQLPDRRWGWLAGFAVCGAAAALVPPWLTTDDQRLRKIRRTTAVVIASWLAALVAINLALGPGITLIVFLLSLRASLPAAAAIETSGDRLAAAKEAAISLASARAVTLAPLSLVSAVLLGLGAVGYKFLAEGLDPMRWPASSVQMIIVVVIWVTAMAVYVALLLWLVSRHPQDH